MLEKIDEEILPGGYVIEWAYDPDVESPRESCDNLGHMYAWGRGFCSPDFNPYSDETDFVRDMLQEHFTHDELLDVVRQGYFESLRLVKGNDGEERLQAFYKSYLTGREDWDDVEDYNEWHDTEELASAICGCAEAPKLLGTKGVILTVYRFEHSDVSYSTSPYNDPWDSGAVGFIWASDDDITREYGDASEASRDKARHVLEAEVREYSAWANGDCYAVMLSKDDVMLDCIGGYIGDDGLDIGIEEMRREVPAIA